MAFLWQVDGTFQGLIISDSAFRKEDSTGLAMRGAVLALAEMSSSPASPGGKIHIIDFYSRRQRRITRSTFAAELHALADSLEIGKIIAMAFTEIATPNLSPAKLSHLEESGKLSVPIEAVVDAKSVFDSLTVTDIKVPSEASLIMILLSVKESLLCHTLRTLWWVDTVDMLSDGLNKGAIARTALLLASQNGTWTVTKPAVSFSEKTQVVAESSWRESVLTVLKIKPELKLEATVVYLARLIGFPPCGSPQGLVVPNGNNNSHPAGSNAACSALELLPVAPKNSPCRKQNNVPHYVLPYPVHCPSGHLSFMESLG